MNQIRVLVSGIPSVFKPNGTSVRTRRVLEALRDCYDVHLVTKADEYVEVSFIQREKTHLLKHERSRLWPARLALFAMKNRFDVVICENEPLAFLVHLIFSKLRAEKVIYEAHGILWQEAEGRGERPTRVRIRRAIERFCVKNADFIIALSEEIRKEHEKFNSRIALIPVFLEETPTGPDSRKDTRERSRRVGVIGPFNNLRNMHTLDFISAHIDDISSDLSFVVIGNCEKRVQHPRISFTGFIDRPEKYNSVLKELDAVVVIEIVATSGPLTKILEPMMLGVPVITTSKGAIGLGHLQNYENIVIAEEKEMVDTLNKVLSDGQLLERIGRNARELAVEHHGFDKNAERLISVVSQVIGSQ